MGNKNLRTGIKELQEILVNPLVEERLAELRYQCYYNIALAHEELNEYNEALSFFNKCAKMKDNDFNTWLKIAAICHKKGYYDQAEYAYQICAKISPSIVYEKMIFEKMTYLAYLQKKHDVCLQRIQFLLDKNHKKSEMLLLKALISKEKG